MAKKRSKTFNVSKYNLLDGEGKRIESFTLEMLSGEDEEAAAERAGRNATGAKLEGHLIAESICKVDGKDVERPFVQWRSWESRTRDFVRQAFHGFNSASPKELEDFRRAALGADEPGSQD